MDYENPEREEGYFSVKRGETEVAQMFRRDDDGLDVRVIDPVFPTADGIHAGDKAAVLFEKHPEVTCKGEPDSQLGMLQCRGAAGDLLFVLDAENYKGKPKGKLSLQKLADRPIYMIVANSDEP